MSSRREVLEEYVRCRRRAGEEQKGCRWCVGRSMGGRGDEQVGSWDDGSVLGHLFRFLVSLRPFVKLIICREDEG